MSNPRRTSPTTTVSVSSYDSALLQAHLGPAEAQYGAVIVASLEGAQGPLACGTEIVDNDANDLNGNLNNLTVNMVWTDLPNETGYRLQIDQLSASYVTEDSFLEAPTNSLSVGNTTGIPGPGSVSNTFRVLGHVGHAPGHGSTPIAGDVVSNECTVTFTVPGNP